MRLLAALLLFAAPAHAQEMPYERWELKNGLDVILLPSDMVPAVAHYLFFDVGAMDDPPGKSGLAHYIEHMLFQGSDGGEPGDYEKIVTSLGGESNAFTGADMTGYHVTIATEHLPRIMALEAERMRRFNPPAAEYARERDVIVEERRSRVDNRPAAQFGEAMNAALYQNHPYKRPIIGWLHEMQGLNEQDVKAHFRRYYRPDNALLVVSGDIDRKELAPLVEKYYGGWKNEGEKAQAVAWAEPPHRAPVRLAMRHPEVTQPRFMRQYLAPSVGQGAALKTVAALSVAQYALGADRTGALYRELVAGQGIAAEIGAGYGGFNRGPAEFSIYAVPREGVEMKALEAAVDAALQKFVNEGPGEAALARARTILTAETVYARDGLQPIAMMSGQLALLGFGPDRLDDWLAAVKSVTVKDIRRALAQVLKARDSATGWLLPLRERENAQ